MDDSSEEIIMNTEPEGLTDEERDLLASQEVATVAPKRRGRHPKVTREVPAETLVVEPIVEPERTVVEPEPESATVDVDADVAAHDNEVPDNAMAVHEAIEVESTTAVRGPYTPIQFGDDGWGGLPIQMRG